MSRVSRIYTAIGNNAFGKTSFEPAQVVTKAQTFTDPDWLYAYATHLMAAADRLRAAQR